MNHTLSDTPSNTPTTVGRRGFAHFAHIAQGGPRYGWGGFAHFAQTPLKLFLDLISIYLNVHTRGTRGGTYTLRTHAQYAQNPQNPQNPRPTPHAAPPAVFNPSVCLMRAASGGRGVS
jgi:hypothetical protein